MDAERGIAQPLRADLVTQSSRFGCNFFVHQLDIDEQNLNARNGFAVCSPTPRCKKQFPAHL